MGISISTTIGFCGLVIMGAVMTVGCAAESVAGPDDVPTRADSRHDSQTSKKDSDDGTASRGSAPAPKEETPSIPSTDPPRGEEPPTPPVDPPAPPESPATITNAGFQASSRCIDVAGNMDPGAKLIAWQCHLAGNQRFTLHANGMLKSQNGNCFDMPANSNAPILWMCHGGDNQKWTYDGKTLRVMGKCLAVRTDSVVTETCNGSAAQKWATLK